MRSVARSNFRIAGSRSTGSTRLATWRRAPRVASSASGGRTSGS